MTAFDASEQKKKKKTFENIVGKGENFCKQQFLLFPQCLQPHER